MKSITLEAEEILTASEIEYLRLWIKDKIVDEPDDKIRELVIQRSLKSSQYQAFKQALEQINKTDVPVTGLIMDMNSGQILGGDTPEEKLKVLLDTMVENTLKSIKNNNKILTSVLTKINVINAKRIEADI